MCVCNDINGTPSLVRVELLSHSGRSSATDEIREFGGRVLDPLEISVVRVTSVLTISNADTRNNLKQSCHDEIENKFG